MSISPGTIRETSSLSVQEPRGTHVEREQELVEAIRRGLIPAFEAVFQEYYNALCVYARAFTRSADAAEEIVADLFFRLWQNRERWEVRGSLRNYLFSAVRSRALNYARDHRNRQRLHAAFGPDVVRTMGRPPTSPEDEASAGELLRAVLDTVDSLPERCREAFLLSRRHELTHAEIADTMGISVSTVEKHVTRATRAVAERVAQWMSDDEE